MSDLRDALKRVQAKPLREALERGYQRDSDRRRREVQPALVWLGPWERDRSYKPGDVVEHNGSSWRCLVAHRDSEPPSVMWELVAEKGDIGPGGIMGPVGPQGAAGAGGTPSNTVVTEQTFGQADTPGVSLEFSRGDHTHGTPDAPAGGDLSFVSQAKWMSD